MIEMKVPDIKRLRAVDRRMSAVHEAGHFVVAR
jgi:hypothetical protein